MMMLIRCQNNLIGLMNSKAAITCSVIVRRQLELIRNLSSAKFSSTKVRTTCCFGCGYCHSYSTQPIRSNPVASRCFSTPSYISHSSAYSSSSSLSNSSPPECGASAECPPSDAFSSSFSETASSATSATTKSASSSSVDPKELQNFQYLSKQWSNESDSFKPLHSLNQLRIPWIVETINKYSSYNNEYGARAERNTTKTNKLVEEMQGELNGSRCKTSNITCGSNMGLRKASLIDSKDESIRVSHKKKGSSSLSGMRIVDVGCGGGLLSIPLARLDVAQLCGIDASEEAIRAARCALSCAFPHRDNKHSAANAERTPQSGIMHDLLSLHSEYNDKHELRHELNDDATSSADINNVKLLCMTVEKFALENAEGFDAVIASEIIEHVANMDSFVGACARLAKPGAPIFFTTINKTLASRLFAVWLAEEVFGIVPQGIHDWTKFVEPDRLRQLLEANGCEVRFLHGLSYNPFTNSWSWTNSTAINYALMAIKRSKHNNIHIDCV